MLSQLKFFISTIVFFSTAIIFNQNAIAQPGNLNIKGNIKISTRNDWEVDECCFHYQNILSGEPTVIPIRRDTAGNFEVSIPLERYQQIYFSKAHKVSGVISYNTGTVYFSFFGKPGQNMKIDFVQNPYKLTLSGDYAAENNQYREYNNAKDRAIKNLYDDVQGKKLSPAEVKAYALKAFKDRLSFNNAYFKNTATSKFVKEQAYYDALYEIQNAAIQFNLSSKNEVTEAMVVDFYKAMQATGTTFADKPGLSVVNTNANPSLKNALALGNDRYKDFIDSYYDVIRRQLIYPKEGTIRPKDLAAHVINTHADVKADHQQILEKVLTGAKLDDEENNMLVNIIHLYGNEYLNTQTSQLEMKQLLAIKDPALRDLAATMNLYKKLEINKLAEIDPLIGIYKKHVTNTYLKNTLLTAYNAQLNRLRYSEISPLSIINSAESFTGPDVLKNMLAKYKGKVIYLDIWATWCVPCIANMPLAAKLREKFKGKDVVFIYACLNSPSQTNWKNLIADQKIEGENYFFDQAQSASIGKSLNLRVYPTYAIIDKNGNIVNNNATKPGEDKTLEDINALLN